MKKLLIISSVAFSIPMSSLGLISCYNIKDQFQKFPVEIKTGSAENIFKQVFTYLSSESKNNVSYQTLEKDKSINAKITILNKNTSDQNITSYNDATNIPSAKELFIYIDIKIFDTNFNTNEWKTKLYYSVVE